MVAVAHRRRYAAQTIRRTSDVLTFAERSEAAKRGALTLTPAERSDRTRRGWLKRKRAMPTAAPLLWNSGNKPNTNIPWQTPNALPAAMTTALPYTADYLTHGGSMGQGTPLHVGSPDSVASVVRELRDAVKADPNGPLIVDSASLLTGQPGDAFFTAVAVGLLGSANGDAPAVIVGDMATWASIQVGPQNAYTMAQTNLGGPVQGGSLMADQALFTALNGMALGPLLANQLTANYRPMVLGGNRAQTPTELADRLNITAEYLTQQGLLSDTDKRSVMTATAKWLATTTVAPRTFTPPSLAEQVPGHRVGTGTVVPTGITPLAGQNTLQPPQGQPITLTPTEIAAREYYIQALRHDVTWQSGGPNDTSRMANATPAEKAMRDAQRKALVDTIFAEAKNRGVQRRPFGQRHAVVTGGPVGSGKSTALAANEIALGGPFLVVNVDDITDRLISLGMVPTMPGLSPAESVHLARDEANAIRDQVFQKAMAEGWDVAYDTTMMYGPFIQGKIADLHRSGYADPTALFVSVPTAQSVKSAEDRWVKGVQDWIQDGEFSPVDGGRFISPNVPARNVPKSDPTLPSGSAETFIGLAAAGTFDKVMVIDNMGNFPNRQIVGLDATVNMPDAQLSGSRARASLAVRQTSSFDAKVQRAVYDGEIARRRSGRSLQGHGIATPQPPSSPPPPAAIPGTPTPPVAAPPVGIPQPAIHLTLSNYQADPRFEQFSSATNYTATGGNAKRGNAVQRRIATTLKKLGKSPSAAQIDALLEDWDRANRAKPISGQSDNQFNHYLANGAKSSLVAAMAVPLLPPVGTPSTAPIVGSGWVTITGLRSDARYQQLPATMQALADNFFLRAGKLSQPETDAYLNGFLSSHLAGGTPGMASSSAQTALSSYRSSGVVPPLVTPATPSSIVPPSVLPTPLQNWGLRPGYLTAAYGAGAPITQFPPALISDDPRIKNMTVGQPTKGQATQMANHIATFAANNGYLTYGDVDAYIDAFVAAPKGSRRFNAARTAMRNHATTSVQVNPPVAPVSNVGRFQRALVGGLVTLTDIKADPRYQSLAPNVQASIDADYTSSAGGTALDGPWTPQEADAYLDAIVAPPPMGHTSMSAARQALQQVRPLVATHGANAVLAFTAIANDPRYLGLPSAGQRVVVADSRSAPSGVFVTFQGPWTAAEADAYLNAYINPNAVTPRLAAQNAVTSLRRGSPSGMVTPTALTPAPPGHLAASLGPTAHIHMDKQALQADPRFVAMGTGGPADYDSIVADLDAGEVAYGGHLPVTALDAYIDAYAAAYWQNAYDEPGARAAGRAALGWGQAPAPAPPTTSAPNNRLAALHGAKTVMRWTDITSDSRFQASRFQAFGGGLQTATANDYTGGANNPTYAGPWTAEEADAYLNTIGDPNLNFPRVMAQQAIAGLRSGAPTSLRHARTSISPTTSNIYDADGFATLPGGPNLIFINNPNHNRLLTTDGRYTDSIYGTSLTAPSRQRIKNQLFSQKWVYPPTNYEADLYLNTWYEEAVKAHNAGQKLDLATRARIGYQALDAISTSRGQGGAADPYSVPRGASVSVPPVPGVAAPTPAPPTPAPTIGGAGWVARTYGTNVAMPSGTLETTLASHPQWPNLTPREQHFMVGRLQYWSHRVGVPFTADQIDTYIDTVTGPTKSTGVKPWAAARAAIKATVPSNLQSVIDTTPGASFVGRNGSYGWPSTFGIQGDARVVKLAKGFQRNIESDLLTSRWANKPNFYETDLYLDSITANVRANPHIRNTPARQRVLMAEARHVIANSRGAPVGTTNTYAVPYNGALPSGAVLPPPPSPAPAAPTPTGTLAGTVGNITVAQLKADPRYLALHYTGQNLVINTDLTTSTTTAYTGPWTGAEADAYLNAAIASGGVGNRVGYGTPTWLRKARQAVLVVRAKAGLPYGVPGSTAKPGPKIPATPRPPVAPGQGPLATALGASTSVGIADIKADPRWGQLGNLLIANDVVSDLRTNRASWSPTDLTAAEADAYIDAAINEAANNPHGYTSASAKAEGRKAVLAIRNAPTAPPVVIPSPSAASMAVNSAPTYGGWTPLHVTPGPPHVGGDPRYAVLKTWDPFVISEIDNDLGIDSLGYANVTPESAEAYLNAYMRTAGIQANMTTLPPRQIQWGTATSGTSGSHSYGTYRAAASGRAAQTRLVVAPGYHADYLQQRPLGSPRGPGGLVTMADLADDTRYTSLSPDEQTQMQTDIGKAIQAGTVSANQADAYLETYYASGDHTQALFNYGAATIGQPLRPPVKPGQASPAGAAVVGWFSTQTAGPGGIITGGTLAAGLGTGTYATNGPQDSRVAGLSQGTRDFIATQLQGLQASTIDTWIDQFLVAYANNGGSSSAASTTATNSIATILAPAAPAAPAALGYIATILATNPVSVGSPSFAALIANDPRYTGSTWAGTTLGGKPANVVIKDDLARFETAKGSPLTADEVDTYLDAFYIAGITNGLRGAMDAGAQAYAAKTGRAANPNIPVAPVVPTPPPAPVTVNLPSSVQGLHDKWASDPRAAFLFQGTQPSTPGNTAPAPTPAANNAYRRTVDAIDRAGATLGLTSTDDLDEANDIALSRYAKEWEDQVKAGTPPDQMPKGKLGKWLYVTRTYALADIYDQMDLANRTDVTIPPTLAKSLTTQYYVTAINRVKGQNLIAPLQRIGTAPGSAFTPFNNLAVAASAPGAPVAVIPKVGQWPQPVNPVDFGDVEDQLANMPSSDIMSNGLVDWAKQRDRRQKWIDSVKDGTAQTRLQLADAADRFANHAMQGIHPAGNRKSGGFEGIRNASYDMVGRQYPSLNSATYNGSPSQQDFEDAELLMRAAAQAPLVPDRTGSGEHIMYRGLAMPVGEIPKYQVGKVLTDPLGQYTLKRDFARAYSTLRGPNGSMRPLDVNGNAIKTQPVLIEVVDAHGLPTTPLAFTARTDNHAQTDEIVSSGQFVIESVTTSQEPIVSFNSSGVSTSSQTELVTHVKVRQITPGWDFSGNQITLLGAPKKVQTATTSRVVAPGGSLSVPGGGAIVPTVGRARRSITPPNLVGAKPKAPKALIDQTDATTRGVALAPDAFPTLARTVFTPPVVGPLVTDMAKRHMPSRGATPVPPTFPDVDAYWGYGGRSAPGSPQAIEVFDSLKALAATTSPTTNAGFFTAAKDFGLMSPVQPNVSDVDIAFMATMLKGYSDGRAWDTVRRDAVGAAYTVAAKYNPETLNPPRGHTPITDATANKWIGDLMAKDNLVGFVFADQYIANGLDAGQPGNANSAYDRAARTTDALELNGSLSAKQAKEIRQYIGAGLPKPPATPGNNLAPSSKGLTVGRKPPVQFPPPPTLPLAPTLTIASPRIAKGAGGRNYGGYQPVQQVWDPDLQSPAAAAAGVPQDTKNLERLYNSLESNEANSISNNFSSYPWSYYSIPNITDPQQIAEMTAIVNAYIAARGNYGNEPLSGGRLTTGRNLARKATPLAQAEMAAIIAKVKADAARPAPVAATVVVAAAPGRPDRARYDLLDDVQHPRPDINPNVMRGPRYAFGDYQGFVRDPVVQEQIATGHWGDGDAPVDFAGIEAYINSSTQFSGQAHGDKVMQLMATVNGYTDQADIVTEDEMDEYIRNGEWAIYRGLGTKAAWDSTRNGTYSFSSAAYGGMIVKGRGTYWTSPPQDGGATSAANNRAAAYQAARSYASQNAPTGRGFVIRATFRPDAHIARRQDFVNMVNIVRGDTTLSAQEKTFLIGDLSTRPPTPQRVTDGDIHFNLDGTDTHGLDPAMLATAFGFDAYYAHEPAGSATEYLTVLNRTALRIQATDIHHG